MRLGKPKKVPPFNAIGAVLPKLLGFSAEAPKLKQHKYGCIPNHGSKEEFIRG